MRTRSLAQLLLAASTTGWVAPATEASIIPISTTIGASAQVSTSGPDGPPFTSSSFNISAPPAKNGAASGGASAGASAAVSGVADTVRTAINVSFSSAAGGAIFAFATAQESIDVARPNRGAAFGIAKAAVDYRFSAPPGTELHVRYRSAGGDGVVFLFQSGPPVSTSSNPAGFFTAAAGGQFLVDAYMVQHGDLYEQFDIKREFEIGIVFGIGELPGLVPENPLIPIPMEPPSEPSIIVGTNLLLPVATDYGVNNFLYIDPAYATGYHYQANGSNFASFIVPSVLPGGDSAFELQFGGQTHSLFAGQEFNFTDYVSDGVGDFILSGINLSETIDPNALPPFVAGVKFTSEGLVDFTQIPIVSAEASPVPEPTSLALLCTGGLSWFAARSRYPKLLGRRGRNWFRPRSTAS